MLHFEKVKPSSERKQKFGREPVSDETKAKIVELYNQDYSLREIADLCDVSRSFISIFIRKLRDEQENTL